MEFNHISVLLNESVDGLNIKENGIYVDCTLGGGGHSSEILKRLTTGKLYCFDQDVNAIQAAEKKMLEIGDNFEIINSNFKNIKHELNERGVECVDGVIFDLGVSSPQFDIPERGFSYRFDATLDMRMDQSSELTAYDVINTYEYKELFKILDWYGGEKHAKQIARNIEAQREIKPIETTFELVDIIKNSIPMRDRRTGSHPAKKSFQAFRIEVNKELEVFENALKDALLLLNSGGRISVITFHSLEDRICKNIFKENSSIKKLPKDIPVIPEEFKPKFKLINKKPIIATESELEHNRRSHSAKLRIIEKL